MFKNKYDLIYFSPSWFKHIFQKLTRDFSDYEVEFLNEELYDFLKPRLKRFKQLCKRAPLDLGRDKNAFKKWTKILDDMLYALEYAYNEQFVDEINDVNITKADRKKIIDRVERGFDYISYYMTDLYF